MACFCLKDIFACLVWFLLFQIVKLCVFLYFFKFVTCNWLLNSNLTSLIHTQIIFEIGFQICNTHCCSERFEESKIKCQQVFMLLALFLTHNLNFFKLSDYCSMFSIVALELKTCCLKCGSIMIGNNKIIQQASAKDIVSCF